MPILINNFQKGMSSSPFVADGAYALSVNMDMFSLPGIARINYLPVKRSSTTILDKPSCIVADPAAANRLYVADEGGEIYVSTDLGVTWAALASSTNKGKYLVVWKDHLIAVGHTSTINTYGPLSGTPAWNTALGTTANVADFIFVSENDDKVYILHNNVIDSLEEVAGQNFDDATGGTYTLTAADLTLPEGYLGICLSEQRENLLIGAYKGASGAKLNQATIFIWDRDATAFDYPVRVPEGLINAMYNVANRVYVSTGRKGKIYLFSEAGLIPATGIPSDYDARKDFSVKPYGMNWWRDRLVIGTVSINGANPTGVYGIKNDAVILEHLIASGEDGSNADLEIGALYAIDDGLDEHLIIGYEDAQNSVFAIDTVTDNANRVGSYGAYFESLMYRVGEHMKPNDLMRVEIQLARPLQTGEGVRVKFRTDINASFTTLGTVDFATDKGIQSHVYPNKIGRAENLQLRVELTTGATKNTPYLYEVRIF